MPTYEFANVETGEITEVRLKIAELQQYKEEHPELELCVSDVKVGDPISLGVRRIDPGFREVLNRIADKTPGGKGLKSQIR